MNSFDLRISESDRESVALLLDREATSLEIYSTKDWIKPVNQRAFAERAARFRSYIAKLRADPNTMFPVSA